MGIISKMLNWWRNYRVLKYSYVISLHTYRILDTRARLRFSLPIPGKDKMVDHSIDDARKFFIVGGDLGVNIEKILSPESIEIYRWLCSDATAKSDRALYRRAMRFERVAKPTRLNISILRKECRALAKRFRAARRALREAKRRLIKFELKDFSIPSVIFVISGYLYTSIVYGYFGIDVSQFFTLGDYLAGSINQIWFPLFALAVYLVYVILTYQQGLEFKTEFSFDTFRKRKFLAPWSELPLVVSAVIGIFGGFSVGVGIGLVSAGLFHFLYTIDGFWYLVPMSCLAFHVWVARLMKRTFENPFRMTAATMLALLFFVGIVAQSVRQIVHIEKGREQATFAIETVNRASAFTDEKFVFLGGNERYIFLLKKGAEAEIIPLEEIKNMHIFKKTWVQRLASWYHRARLFFRDLLGNIGALHFW